MAKQALPVGISHQQCKKKENIGKKENPEGAQTNSNIARHCKRQQNHARTQNKKQPNIKTKKIG